MIGNSNEILTKIIYGELKLNEWLRVNKVQVIDIKYSVSERDQDRFLVIFKNKPSIN